MTTRADFAAVVLRNDLRMAIWQRRLRDEVLAAYRHRVALIGRFDQLAYLLVRDDIDRLYAAAYARWPGDIDAPLGQLIREVIGFSGAVPIRRAIEDIKRRVPVPIWRAIQREAA